jgi:hypothetical protein
VREGKKEEREGGTEERKEGRKEGNASIMYSLKISL